MLDGVAARSGGADVAAEIQRRRRALAAAGLDPDLAVTRGASFANEVWIGDEVVVRINHAEQLGGDPERSCARRRSQRGCRARRATPRFWTPAATGTWRGS